MLTRSTTMPFALRDLVALTKPRLSSLVIITAGGGLAVAPGHMHPLRVVVTLLATSLVVGAANALNCYIERDLDRAMNRTRNRPLPAGRLDPRVALLVAFALAAVAVPALTFAANPLTALLAVVALGTYVLVYTPMKQRSTAALWIGAIPGAIPPLMGWTAVRDAIEPPGLVLFAILFCWQIPHFIAIGLNASDDYARAGHRILPLAMSDIGVKLTALAWTATLVPISLLLYPQGVAGVAYFATAGVLGALFLGWCVAGLFRPASDKRWAFSLFRVSLLYLTGLFVALFVNAR